MSDDPRYCYPGSPVLRNLLGIEDEAELERVERLLVQQRVEEGTPPGRFDLSHLQAIHKHLFQDIYQWAGEIRQVEISKNGNQFQPCRFIRTGMADIHARLETSDFLRGLDPDQFASAAGQVIGDVNHVHPFREGNGRTQLEYLHQLADQAGHDLSAARLDPVRWIKASQAAHRGEYGPMAMAIREALERQKSPAERGRDEAARAVREEDLERER